MAVFLFNLVSYMPAIVQLLVVLELSTFLVSTTVENYTVSKLNS